MGGRACADTEVTAGDGLGGGDRQWKRGRQVGHRFRRRGEPMAATLARTLDQLRSSDRDRVLARYELSLEAVRRPELRTALNAGSHRVRDAIANQLAEDGVPDPHVVASDIMALFDGLLFRELTAPDDQRTSRAELRRAFDRLLPQRA